LYSKLSLVQAWEVRTRVAYHRQDVLIHSLLIPSWALCPVKCAQRARRLRAAAVLVVSLVFSMTAATADTLEPSPAEQFKQFIQFRPTIKRLVFTEKAYLPVHNLFPPGTPLSNRVGVATYEAQWQKNALRMNRIRGTNVALPESYNGFLLSSFSNDVWILYRRAARYWHKEPINPGFTNVSSAFARNPMKDNLETYQSLLNHVLNLGIFHLDAGSVHWNGDAFQGVYPERNLQIYGDLLVGQDGRPAQLRANYRWETNLHTYITRYEYAANHRFDFLPSSFKTWFLKNGREQLWDEITISQLETSETNLPPDVFDPNDVITRMRLPVQIFTNGTFFSRDSAGRLVPLPSQNSVQGPRSISSLSVYAWIMALTLLSLWLLARAEQRTQTVTN
jgi:hypothetical protein